MVSLNNTVSATQSAQQNVYSLRQGNSRIAGSIPVWDKPKTAKTDIVEHLQASLISPDNINSVKQAEAYAPSRSAGATPKQFGFADLIDIVNPLQHIPVVGTAYRNMTGDDISPFSKIAGGTLFGGGLGAASAIIDVAVEHETGKDITQHAFTMAKNASSNAEPANPEKRLNDAVTELAQFGEQGELGAAIAFADLGNSQYQKTISKQVADGRTAGLYKEVKVDLTAHRDTSPTAHIDPITLMTLNEMPPRRAF